MEEAQKFHIHGTESRTEIKERPHLIRFWCQAYKITWISEEVLPQAILASHMQVSVHIKRCDPTAVCQWEQPQPCFAQSLQDTAISRYCFTLAAPCFNRAGYKMLTQKLLSPPAVEEGLQPCPEGGGRHSSSSTLGVIIYGLSITGRLYLFFSPFKYTKNSKPEIRFSNQETNTGF